jgi:hypothetical protein
MYSHRGTKKGLKGRKIVYCCLCVETEPLKVPSCMVTDSRGKFAGELRSLGGGAPNLWAVSRQLSRQSFCSEPSNKFYRPPSEFSFPLSSFSTCSYFQTPSLHPSTRRSPQSLAHACRGFPHQWHAAASRSSIIGHPQRVAHPHTASRHSFPLHSISLEVTHLRLFSGARLCYLASPHFQASWTCSPTCLHSSFLRSQRDRSAKPFYDLTAGAIRRQRPLHLRRPIRGICCK